MGQRAVAASARIFFAAAAILLLTGCDQKPATPAGRTGAKKPTVASLVPAATDLLIGMGAGDHLVAVSSWDADRPEISGLPKVGDYRTIDWERLSILRPDLMIVQFRPDKMPAGLQDRADGMGIKVVNVKINLLADMYATIDELGEATHEKDKARRGKDQIRDQLEALAATVGKDRQVTALITRAEPSNALACVGGGNYLDELLTLAGGKNVLGGGENSYPTIDREKLLALDPQVVFVLLPGASPQVIESTKKFWQSTPQISAVRNGRIHIMTDSDLLLPGYGVVRIARQFHEHLHPQTPSSKP